MCDNDQATIDRERIAQDLRRLSDFKSVERDEDEGHRSIEVELNFDPDHKDK